MAGVISTVILVVVQRGLPKVAPKPLAVSQAIGVCQLAGVYITVLLLLTSASLSLRRSRKAKAYTSSLAGTRSEERINQDRYTTYCEAIRSKGVQMSKCPSR